MSKPIYLRVDRRYFPLNSSELDDVIFNSDINDPDRLYLSYSSSLLEDDINALLKLIKNPQIQIARLELKVNPEIIKTEQFKELVEKLNPSGALHYLNLDFGDHLPAEQMNSALLESGIADLASYPITVSYPLREELDKTFIEKIISKVRYYEQNPISAPKIREASQDDPNSPRIKLKDIISNQKLRDDDNLVSIDVAIEAESQVEAEMEVEVEASVEAQLEHYTGLKYDYSKFMKQEYNHHNLEITRARNGNFRTYLKSIQQELFAQLPCAIQYVTPAAADKIHRDCAQMMSFNKDNLPPGMFLQKTLEGALVLDYDVGHERNYNTFTPMDNLRYEEEEKAYFEGNLVSDELLLPDDFKEYKSRYVINKNNFMNLSVRYGPNKVRDFMTLFEVDNAEEHKALTKCMSAVEMYVISFSQCDFMVKGTWFHDCMQRIKQENDVAKLACLTSLLNASQYARHDLEHTLNAFDVFWEEIQRLCPEEQLERIKFTKWKSGEAVIPPVVAMERLLTILQNARDITSQIDYLKEVPTGAFRAYYASAYEGFGMVHKDMDISWSPNVYNMQYLTDWPPNLNLAYFKNTFILFNDELFYIPSDLQPQPISYTTKFVDGVNIFEKHGKGILKELKEKKFIQIPQEYLFFLTKYKPAPIPYNQHAKVYQVDLSILRNMALKEDVIYYPKFYAYLHRYMGQQNTGISYADFRAQTADCNFQHQDKTVAFALLFFITDMNYDEQLGITPLISKLKQLTPGVLSNLAETLYHLQGRGVVLNNQEGLIILNELLTKDPEIVLKELNNRTLIITEYDEVLNKFKNIALSIKNAIKESRMDVNLAHRILNTLQSFSEEHQQELFNALKLELKGDMDSLCDHINQLRVAALPPKYITHYIQLKELDCKLLIERFTTDQHDPILAYILSEDFIGNSSDAKKLLDLSQDNPNKHKIVALLKNNNILQHIHDSTVLDILAKSYDTMLPDKQLSVEQWQELTGLLSSLDNRDSIISLYKITAPNSICLFNALKNNKLDALEREPFGPRSDEQHFDVSQVERVINESLDWSNNTIYSYKYRKQLMEAFTFVNAIGYKLPIFEGKTAKKLSNAEIQTYFSGIKNRNILQDLSPFQQQLIALSLIREALFRSTGQMAYSTQIIAIIDCLMHEGHVISNIDTGQGKSLIDIAKSALLWLDSDRVDITTSSIVDAKRDLENFSPFLSFLNIPHGHKPLTTQSERSDFVSDGINITTFAQMSLFQAKMKMEGSSLDKKTDIVSLIINESDYSLLEDRTVYRYATQSTHGLSPQAEWIYSAINEFVFDPKFTSRTTSAQRDVLNLKAFIKNYAKEHNKQSNIISEISSDQWLKWIEAALLVQYKLKENDDFIVPDEQQAVTIRGKKQMSHVVKLLMTEGKVKTKVSVDAKFGNGVQQLLYAKLNKDYPNKIFKIEPETNTILSSNNRSLIERYLKREKPGIIWGSSGTVGSISEREELHTKYNIDFSMIAAHQKKIIELHDAQFYNNQNAQFDAIKTKMAQVKLDNKARPQLIFCKDINSAIKLHALLAKTHPDNLQIYTGGDNEAAFVAKAALGGMITVCTPAIGRNTDVLYNRAVGMNVMHTSINSYNLETQLTGRTGRQGSGGDIDFYFNEKELGGKTKEQIQDEIYKNSQNDRAFSEEIYSILGNVLIQLEQGALQPNTVDFLNNTWSKLSVKYERLYRELKINEHYNREAFVNVIVGELEGYLLDKQQILDAVTRQFEAKDKYNPYTSEVKLKDCIPPVELSYALLNKDKVQQPLDAATRKQIKDKVNGLLKDYKNGKKIEYHAEYIRYLSKGDATQNDIRTIHQECIKEFLDKQAKQSLPWYKRLFGYQSMLNKVTNSANYLIVFRSLLHVPSTVKDTKTELDIAKNAAIALLKEYRYQSLWFIHDERKKMSEKLIQDLDQVSDLATMIKTLDSFQVSLAKKDSEINKTRIWFPLHSSGSSRLQNTISSALNLTSALHDKLSNNYKELLEELVQTDKNNQKVIKQQIKTSIHLRERPGFFANVGKYKDKKDKDNKEDDLDNVLKNI